MYAVDTLPLIRSLHNPSQVWYADDASICGHLNNINEWLSQLCSKGSVFTYYPEPSKSFCLLMTDIGLKLKDCSVFWVFGLVQVIVSWVVMWVIKLIMYYMYLTRFSCESQICCPLQRLL